MAGGIETYSSQPRAAVFEHQGGDVVANHAAFGEPLDRCQQRLHAIPARRAQAFSRRADAQAFGIEKRALGVFRLGEAVADRSRSCRPAQAASGPFETARPRSSPPASRKCAACAGGRRRPTRNGAGWPALEVAQQARGIERAIKNGRVFFAARAFEQKRVQPLHDGFDVPRFGRSHQERALQQAGQQRRADALARKHRRPRRPTDPARPGARRNNRRPPASKECSSRRRETIRRPASTRGSRPCWIPRAIFSSSSMRSLTRSSSSRRAFSRMVEASIASVCNKLAVARRKIRRSHARIHINSPTVASAVEVMRVSSTVPLRM